MGLEISMAKNRKASSTPQEIGLFGSGAEELRASGSNVGGGSFLLPLKRHKWAAAVLLLLSIGAFGAGLKYLEESAKTEMKMAAKDRSLISSINPFIPSALPLPTPQLAKEYIYAGSQLLAVEDKNAAAAPPTDLAVWRPSNGGWYVLGGPGSAQTITTGWGAQGDEAVPGDYDGDGKTDFSVFRPSENKWYIIRSSTNTSETLTFGEEGDKPAQADYDGDGRTDAAVVRPPPASNPTAAIVWYVQGTSNGFYYSTWGQANDVPAPADYDGDGKADIAIWRPSTSTFYSVNSSNSSWQTPAMAQSGEAVSADYDGDGKTDFAVFAASTGTWKVLQSTTGTFATTTGWGTTNDEPVPNDYDGDARADLTVWRPADGTWYIKQSATGTIRNQVWGQNGDIPVPAYFRR